MRMPKRHHLVVAAVAVSSTTAAYGHHSIAGVYDTRREVAVEGVVTQFQFVSPHPFVIVEVVRSAVAEEWRFDMDDRNEMGEIGMTASTLRTGDRIVVTGSPAREEPRRLYIQRFERPSDGFSYEQVRSSPRLRKAVAPAPTR
jgi:hypothetical protein